MPSDKELLDEYNRRREDRLTDRVDQIYHVVTRTEVQVKELMHADAHTRLCTLESAHKFWKSLFLYGAGVIGAAGAALLQYLKP